MQRLITLVGIIVLFCSTISKGQNHYDGYIPNQSEETGVVSETGETKEVPPVPLRKTRYADVIWSKIVSRIVNLDDPENARMVSPIGQSYEKENLFGAMLKGVKEGSITPYDAVGQNELGEEITYADILSRLGASSDSISVVDPATGESVMRAIEEDPKLHEVKTLLIKEFWYFDINRSEMDVRIMAICPVRTYYKPEDTNRTTPIKSALFWAPYPQCRPVLSNTFTGSKINNMATLSYDNILITRKFKSYIVKNFGLEDEDLEDGEIMPTDRESMQKESDKLEKEYFAVTKVLWGPGEGIINNDPPVVEEKKGLFGLKKKKNKKSKETPTEDEVLDTNTEITSAPETATVSDPAPTEIEVTDNL